MILPDYKVESSGDGNSTTDEWIKITFDKLKVIIYGDAKHSSTQIHYYINPGCRRRDIDLSYYMNAVNDYLISHPHYKIVKNKSINIFDFNLIKEVEIHNLKVSSNEFQIINDKYPNIVGVTTINCTIYKEALIGCLKCSYSDNSSVIMSLDSFNGFLGEIIRLHKTHIINMNKNMLNLPRCVILKMEGVNLDYERLFLTTNAPKMRKLDIYKDKGKRLNSQELLFISGFYNLESIYINGVVDNYKQIEKLEKLRELRGIIISNKKELDKIKEKRINNYLELKEKGASQEILQAYLTKQYMLIQNKYLKLLHKIYVPRLERVEWENKILTNNLETIKEELISISNMPINIRKNISREMKKYSDFDIINGLIFDSQSKDDEFVLENYSSNPFDYGEFEYYVKSKKIIYDD